MGGVFSYSVCMTVWGESLVIVCVYDCMGGVFSYSVCMTVWGESLVIVHTYITHQPGHFLLRGDRNEPYNFDDQCQRSGVKIPSP